MTRLTLNLILLVTVLSMLTIGAGKLLGQFRDANRLLYIRRHNDYQQIFLLDTNAHIEHRLTNSPIGHSYAIWSPDGRSIADFRADGLHVMDAYGRNDRPLLENADSCLVVACWSPDGNWLIVHVIERDASGARIVNTITGEVRWLVENQNIRDPIQWSPNDAYFIWYRDTVPPSTNQFIRYRNTVPVSTNQFIVVNVETGEILLATDDQGVEVNGTWSPDGRYIVYVQAEDDDREIYVGDIDSGTTWNVSQMPDSRDFSPVWSPDGTHIAFRSGDRIAIVDVNGENRRILHPTAPIDQLYGWIDSQLLIRNRIDSTAQHRALIWMDVNTGENRQIADDDFDTGAPHLSPDGRRLIYYNLRDSLVQVVTTEGERLWTVAFGDGGLSAGSAWSPDGRQVMFSVFSSGDIVYILNVDSGEYITIGNAFAAQWQP